MQSTARFGYKSYFMEDHCNWQDFGFSDNSFRKGRGLSRANGKHRISPNWGMDGIQKAEAVNGTPKQLQNKILNMYTTL